MKSSLTRFFAWQLVSVLFVLWQPAVAQPAQGAVADGVIYTNFTRNGPMEIHVIRIPRENAFLEIKSIHSGGKPIGRSRVSDQLKLIEGEEPLAAINGDFFQLEGPFAGDPRGLQIMNEALISAPAGSSSFWIDSAGNPHMANTRSAVRITWPNGSTSPLGLNGKCEAGELELYTPDLEVGTRGNTGREIVLVAEGSTTNATLRAGKEYSLRVLEIREAREQPIPPGAFLLALGQTAARKAPTIRTGAVVKISTATIPTLRGVRSAISGGPILVISGKRQQFDKAESNAFKHRFMVEKHPRSALGWNKQEYFWVEVDGRSKESVGMTLNELGALMVELGCDEAMNLDGGGSSTIWFDGNVRNRPSDGAERPVANCLALVHKSARPK